MASFSKSILKKVLITILALLICSFVFVQMQLKGGEGRVLDSTTKQPIPDATVTLECLKSQFHGTKKVRDVSVSTDKDGVYRFTFWDVVGCDRGFVKPFKEGHKNSSSIHTGYSYTSYGRIPPVRYLTKDSDVIMLSLKALEYLGNGKTYRNGVRAYVSEYEYSYRNFIRAKAMAKTDRELEYVVSHYCENLISLYTYLSSKDKAHIKSMSYSFRWRGVPTSGEHNHEREVVTYCL